MDTGTRNVWVFGGTGFTGKALVKHLTLDKSNRLHLLVHKNNFLRPLEHITTVMGSLADFDPFWLDRYPPDVIFHMARPAGSNMLTRTIRSRSGEQANRRLVKMLGELPRPPVVVYVSGSLVYGQHTSGNPATELSGPDPASFAGFYFRNERPWIAAQEEGTLDVRFARPGWIVGPASWFLNYFWNPYLHTGRVPCYGDGTQPMSAIHIDDCAAMINTLAVNGSRGTNLNIFTGGIITQQKFSAIMADLLKAEIELISYERTRRKYGKTTADALVSSSPMNTLYDELHLKTGIRFRNVADMLTDVIRFLKSK